MKGNVKTVSKYAVIFHRPPLIKRLHNCFGAPKNPQNVSSMHQSLKQKSPRSRESSLL